MEASRDKRFAWPIKAPLKLGKGYYWRMGSGALHCGQDMALGQLGKDVLAAAAGTVAFAGVHLIDRDKKPDARGIWIRITHSMPDGSRWATVYAHLQETLVKEGDSVAKGQPIGRVGNTGRSRVGKEKVLRYSVSPHLHFEIHDLSLTTKEKRVEPIPLLPDDDEVEKDDGRSAHAATSARAHAASSSAETLPLDVVEVGFRGFHLFRIYLLPTLTFDKVPAADRKNLLRNPTTLRAPIALKGKCENVPDNTACTLTWLVQKKHDKQAPAPRESRQLDARIRVEGERFQVQVDGRDPEVHIITDGLFNEGLLGAMIEFPDHPHAGPSELTPCYAFDNPLKLVKPKPEKDDVIASRRMGAVITFEPEVAGIFKDCDIELLITEKRCGTVGPLRFWPQSGAKAYKAVRWAIGFTDLERRNPCYLNDADDYEFVYTLSAFESKAPVYTAAQIAETGKIKVKKPRLASFHVRAAGNGLVARGKIEDLEAGTPMPLWVRCADTPAEEKVGKWRSAPVTTRPSSSGAFEARFPLPAGAVKHVFGFLTILGHDKQPLKGMALALAHDEDEIIGFDGASFRYARDKIKYLCSSEAAAHGANPYGGLDLQVGDSDSQKHYSSRKPDAGKKTGSTQGAGQEPARPEGFVAELQRDLHTLGFAINFDREGEFDLKTKWAVREFQLHAKLPRVARDDREPGQPQDAKPYVEHLKSVPNDSPYRGPISGVANRRTRRLVKHWLQERWRCPVVIGAYKVRKPGEPPDGPAEKGMENIWLHHDVKDRNLRMYAHDFSGYYQQFEPDLKDAPIPVGKYEAGGTGGPTTLYMGEATEVLPSTLVGHENLSDWERCAFRVLRCQAEAECAAHFDRCNAWDSAFFSMGLSHWTMNGELEGYLAYLQFAEPQAYEQAFGSFGLWPAAEWNGLKATRLGTYTTRPMLEAEEQTGKSAQDDHEELIKKGSRRFYTVKKDARCMDYFRSWHWCYRFITAARTIKSVRLAMWPYGRKRPENILNAPWGAGVSGKAKVGDVITSEMGVGLIHRWHGSRPAHIVNDDAGKALQDALSKAKRLNPGLRWYDPPGSWGDEEEKVLVRAIVAVAKNTIVNRKPMFDSLRDHVLSWPTATKRFTLDRDRWGRNPDYDASSPESDGNRQYGLSWRRGSYKREPT
jgi:murein DD-endopeptidase MepM/ murein hydrolase activator NlpD/peptidoglycan hydrolase-like protein with peptidoglycan-binding domain